MMGEIFDCGNGVMLGIGCGLWMFWVLLMGVMGKVEVGGKMCY